MQSPLVAELVAMAFRADDAAYFDADGGLVAEPALITGTGFDC